MLHTDSHPPTGKLPPTLYAALACLCLALAPAATDARAAARRQQPAAGQQQQQRARTKRVTPLRKSESAQGSRVTITSDGGALNDYSAYRSGDRFIVVIPQAEAAGGGGGVSGRGFEGAQVSKRGNDLVYTFKLEPGATARVNQRFNQLDVQFTSKQAGQPAQGQAATPAATPAPTPRAQRTPPELAGTQTPTTAGATPDPRATGQHDHGAHNPAAVPTPAGGVTTPAGSAPPFGQEAAPSPAASDTPPATPTVGPTAEQIAQALPQQNVPPPIAVPQTAPAPSRTLGATLVNNWPWIIAALLGLGVVLLLVGRSGARGAQQPPPAPAALKETPAAKLPAATVTAKPATTTTAKPTTTTATATPSTQATTTPAPTASTPASTPASASAISAAALTAASAAAGQDKKKRGKKAKRAAAKAEAARIEAQSAQARKAARVEPADAEPASATAETKGAETVGALGAAGLVAGAAALASAGAAGEEKGVELAATPADTERVSEEIAKLLAGESYDESVVAAPDTATRQFVASELSAALAGRNSERNERARAAFVKHGYFADAARDLRSAEAPAQRASAAHALSLLGDRAATPHLVEALEDPSPDVRRATVEALAQLKDPAAVGPLDALRWRETSRQVPRTLIQHAVEACTPEEIEEPAEADEVTLVRDPEEVTLVRAARDATGETSKSIELAPAADELAPAAEAVGVEAATKEIELAPAAPEAEPATAAAEAEPATDAAEAAPATGAAEAVVATGAADVATGAAEAEHAAAVAETETAPSSSEIEPAVSLAEAESAVDVAEAAPVAVASEIEAAPVASVEAESATEIESSSAVREIELASVETAEAGEQESPLSEAITARFAGELGAVDSRSAEPGVFDVRSVEPAESREVEPAQSSEIETAQSREIEIAQSREIEVAPTAVDAAPASGERARALEQVYTFDESEAAASAARREHSRREAGGEETAATREDGEAMTAELPVYVAPEFAVARDAEAGAADDWVDVDVVETRQPAAVEAPGAAEEKGIAEFEEKGFDVFEEKGIEPVFAGDAAEPGEDSPLDLSGPAETGIVQARPVSEIDLAGQGAREEAPQAFASASESARASASADEAGFNVTPLETGLAPSLTEAGELSIIPKAIQLRLESDDASERAESVRALARLNTEEAFGQICAAFDDTDQRVRNAAARALYEVSDDRAESFTRALRESPAERRRKIGEALAASGLADEAVGRLTGESRERTYDAFSLLFLMAKAGETAPLVRAVESHSDNEVRLAVVKLLALSGQQEVLPSFRRLAVRGSLPTEVRSAVMEAIYQISSSSSGGGAGSNQPAGTTSRTN